MSNQLVITSGAKVRSLEGVITGSTGVLNSLPINAANGIPQLDSSGKILVSQLPNSVMEYKGTWNAATNTPTLVNGTGNQGDVYLCNVAGTVNFGAGPISFVVGDQVIYSGTIWQRASGATGTVTSVAVTESGDALNITGSPITTSGTINIGFAGSSAQYVAGNGALVTFPTIISSIGLTMPSAFTVSNSPLTANGTIAVTGAGFPSQYIRGDGTLADFPTSGGGGSSVSYYLNGGTNQGTISGTTYYEMSRTADTGTGVDFAKSGNGLIVSFLTDANDPAQLNIPGGNWNYEIYASMSSNGGTPQLYAELYKYDGTTFTLISTSTNEILYDGTTLNLYTFAMSVPSTTLTVTDRLAIKLYATNSGGKTTTVHTQNGHLCQVITTFSTGITAVNGLTTQVQYFATGTSGTDFNISSATATHTFNLPTASATNRGALSSADWNTFNNKQNALTNPVTGTSVTSRIAYFNGTSSITGSSNLNFDGNNLLIGNVSTGLAQLHIYNASAAASMLLQTNSTTDYSEIAVRNNSSTATSYFRQYSTAATGSDFGISRAGLALFFSNFATNFAIGTRNGGSLIFGTNDNERMRITSVGSAGLGVTPKSWQSIYFIPFEIGNSSSRMFLTGRSDSSIEGNIGINAYYDSGWKYTNTGVANLMVMDGGFTFRNAASGTAGAALTWTDALRIASSGAATFSYAGKDGLVISDTTSQATGVGGSILFQGVYTNGGSPLPFGRISLMKENSTNANYSFGMGFYTSANGGSNPSTSPNFYIAGSGNVGIGTSSPTSPLHVGTATSGNQKIQQWGEPGFVDNYGLILRGSSLDGVFKFYGLNNGTETTAPILSMNRNSGNVGIGTSSPSYKLDTYGTSGTTSLRVRDGNLTATAQILLECANTFSGISQAFISGVGTNGGNNSIDLLFGTASGGGSATERARITSEGTVVAGSTLAVPTGGELGAWSWIPSQNRAYFSGTGGASAGFNRFANTGDVIAINYAGTGVGSISTNGATTSYNITSDYRLKEDLKEINGLEKVSAIKVYDFKWKALDERMDGVIAHELAEVLPYAVNGEKDGLDENGEIKAQGVDYSKLVPIMIKAIQEQQVQIEELKAKING